MSRHRTVILAVVALGLTAASAPSALAGKPKPKPKPLHEKYTVNDPTPNPVLEGTFGSYCRGGFPGDALGDEKGHNFKVTGPGTLDAALSGVIGDWVFELRDSKGNTIIGDDVNPPESEALFVTIKKAGTYSLWACNSNGGPSVTVEYTYTYK